MSERDSPPPRSHLLSNRRLAWLFAVTVLVVIVVLFVADNFVFVRLRLLTIDTHVRLAWVMLGTLLAGMVIGAVGAWLIGRGRR